MSDPSTDYQLRVNECFQFRGAASVILETIMNVALRGEAVPGTRIALMSTQERLDFIAREAERLLERAKA